MTYFSIITADPVYLAVFLFILLVAVLSVAKVDIGKWAFRGVIGVLGILAVVQHAVFLHDAFISYQNGKEAFVAFAETSYDRTIMLFLLWLGSSVVLLFATYQLMQQIGITKKSTPGSAPKKPGE